MYGPSKIVYQETDSQQQQNSKPLSNAQNNDHLNNSQKSFFQLGIPVDAFGVLKGHQKGISSISVDPKGYRMVTGGLDSHIRFWDFHGMNKNMNSFRIVQPFEGTPIRNLNWNVTGTHIMIVCGGTQIVMLDRDGAKSIYTVKGYMYLKQLNKTKGHTNTIYDGHFHPINANEFVSCSGDGSIRLWDLEQKLQGIEKQLGHKTLLKCRDQKNNMVGVTNVNYTTDGKMVFGGCLDGSLQGFSTKNNLHRPEMLIRQAHRSQQQYTSILSYKDSQKIVTRNTDHTVKVWDLRMFKKPYVHYSHLPNHFPGNKMCWSPNGETLLVGTSIDKQQDEKQGYLHFFNSTTFQKLKTINMGPVSVHGLTWSPILNQIVVGTSDGQAKIYFDVRLSNKGALQCVDKKPRVDKDPVFDYSLPVYLPHSLPLYKQNPTNRKKKQTQQMRRDPILSANPFVPIQGPNKGGKQMVAHTPIQFMIKTLKEDVEKVKDDRKQLWQIGKFTDKKNQYTLAYQVNQPTKIFSDQPNETKQFQLLQKLEKICPHCGLKLCTCARKHIMDSDAEQEQQDDKKGYR